jgi:hypothetical protein
MPWERIYSVPVETSNCLNAVADRKATQAVVASCYADCILADAAARRNGSAERVDSKAINQAILARWPKGLERVKKLAWKEAERRARG